MKKISKIQIENCRAYYDRIIFALPHGENLLLYGENGSGKTSLYKALNDFIQSFYSKVIYTPNRYKLGCPGIITLSIGDYDSVAKKIDNEIDLSFTEGSDNTSVPNTAFIKALALSKGFLNYRDLLKVYLYEDSNPNLFDLFVLELLKNHIPLAQGRQKSLKKEWEKLNGDIFEVYNRNELKHKRGLIELKNFETILKSVLSSLFDNVNVYLSKYFPNFFLELDYKLEPMTFSYGNNKTKWNIHKDLRLDIKLCNSAIHGYTENLNEARLSSIAICLYLAALKANPGSDMRLLFLDDIFIGIDSANRLPILKILNDEFTDFQIIIATYDRSWYYMAKKFISCHTPDKWRTFNLFSLPHNEGGQTFMVPTVTDGNTAFDRAKEYLHGHRDIDLPAAANYFRKALEELISEENLPKEMFLNEDYTIIPGFKLTQRVQSLANLFNQIGEETKHIYIIKSCLHPLIHPLSHYEEEAQVYREELLEVEKAINVLRTQINGLSTKCQILLGKGNSLFIHYDVADGSYKSKYKLLLEENVWLYKDITGNPKLTEGKCRLTHMEGEENGSPLNPYSPKKDLEQFHYSSIEDALKKIYEHETKVKNHAVIAHNQYDIIYRPIKNGEECISEKIKAFIAANKL